MGMRAAGAGKLVELLVAGFVVAVIASIGFPIMLSVKDAAAISAFAQLNRQLGLEQTTLIMDSGNYAQDSELLESLLTDGMEQFSGELIDTKVTPDGWCTVAVMRGGIIDGQVAVLRSFGSEPVKLVGSLSEASHYC